MNESKTVGAVSNREFFDLSIPELILITDSTQQESERFFNIVEASLCGGVDAVLVHEKQMDSAHFLAFCSRLRTLTVAHKALLIVHSQADVAQAVAADGVHVAAADMEEIAGMHQWLKDAKMMFSASCHNAEELKQAEHCGADFALLSPVFPTNSHPGAPHLGSKHFRTLADASPLPVIALGGIVPGNRNELAGYPVAVISAIMHADNPEQAARCLYNRSR